MIHTLIGHLKNSEAIYVDSEDNILIEKDHERLVFATVKEWIEANRIISKKKHAEASAHRCLSGQATITGKAAHSSSIEPQEALQSSRDCKQ